MRAVLLDKYAARGYSVGMERCVYERCVALLRRELVPAMGCTEPIAVAYAAALARETLGTLPDAVTISVSGNILKNAKSVVVPNTGGLRGIAAAAAAGIAEGRAERLLEVLADADEEASARISDYLRRAEFCVEQSGAGCVFDIGVRVRRGEHTAYVRIAGHHTNVVRIEKDGACMLEKQVTGEEDDWAEQPDATLSVQQIVEFADEADLADVAPLLERQIACNGAIAEEGLKNDYGARVGKILLASFGDGVHNRAKAAAAAGSDARMNGCELPVVIVSGSGNQGMTASLPVMVYARHWNAPHEKLLRALIVSNLITVHLKAGIGRLSAYCGAVSAGCGAGAGVCYLAGGDYGQVAHTVANALAIESGVICDGAKASCAAKVASAVEAGLLGMEMSRRGSEFRGGDGIVEKGVENTIRNVGDLARNGMRETDEEILRLMLKNM